MKKILTILFAALIGWAVIHSAYAFIMSGMPIDAGSVGAWYYTNTTDSYDDSAAESAGNAICADITFDTGGDVTKIGIKVPSTDTDDFKVAIYEVDNPTDLLHNCGEQTDSLTTGWNDVTCSSSYTVTATTYRFCYNISGAITVNHNNSSTGYWGAKAYADFPAASQGLAADSGKLHALRAYLE